MLVQEEGTLVAELFYKIYKQASVAHLSEKKTIILVKACY
jgi:hypothetical protein